MSLLIVYMHTASLFVWPLTSFAIDILRPWYVLRTDLGIYLSMLPAKAFKKYMQRQCTAEDKVFALITCLYDILSY